MGLFKSLKSIFCKNHDYIITHVTDGSREGTMFIDLVCKTCGSTMQTFHDLTEAEGSTVSITPEVAKLLDTQKEVSFRHPMIEELLIKDKYLEKKGIGNESHNVTITDQGYNKTAFNDVVKMYCDEIKKRLGIKISPKQFIFESPFNNKLTKFVFPMPPGLSDEEKLHFDVVKKNVQLKIKGVKKYEKINLIGVRKIVIYSSEIANLVDIIKKDEQLHNFNGPLFLNLQIWFYTCVLDYDRFTDFAKQIDKYLDLIKVDYIDIKKRVIDAVDQASSNLHSEVSKEIEMSKKRMQNIVVEMGKQGAVKLIYMRNYTWDINDIKKKQPDLLKKLSNLMKFMKSTLNSEGRHKDFLIPTFELSTDLDLVSAYGCFATVNNKTGLDGSIFRSEITNRMKVL